VARYAAVLNGILWVLGTGAQWRELPKKYPPYQTCHRRFQRWVREGKLEEILRVLAEQLHARGKLELEEGFIDAPSRGQKRGLAVGPTKRGKGTKILAICTDHSLPLAVGIQSARRTKASWSKKSSGKASSTNFPTTDWRRRLR